MCIVHEHISALKVQNAKELYTPSFGGERGMGVGL